MVCTSSRIMRQRFFRRYSINRESRSGMLLGSSISGWFKRNSRRFFRVVSKGGEWRRLRQMTYSKLCWIFWMRWRESAVLPIPLSPDMAARVDFSWTIHFSRVASSDVRSDNDEIWGVSAKSSLVWSWEVSEVGVEGDTFPLTRSHLADQLLQQENCRVWVRCDRLHNITVSNYFRG